MAGQAEAAGVDIFPGYAAAGVRYVEYGGVGDGAVGGVIVGDMGVGRDGKPRDTWMQGIEIHAPLTVLAEVV